jgi:hypothetical protein
MVVQKWWPGPDAEQGEQEQKTFWRKDVDGHRRIFASL